MSQRSEQEVYGIQPPIVDESTEEEWEEERRRKRYIPAAACAVKAPYGDHKYTEIACFVCAGNSKGDRFLLGVCELRDHMIADHPKTAVPRSIADMVSRCTRRVFEWRETKLLFKKNREAPKSNIEFYPQGLMWDDLRISAN